MRLSDPPPAAAPAAWSSIRSSSIRGCHTARVDALIPCQETQRGHRAQEALNVLVGRSGLVKLSNTVTALVEQTYDIATGFAETVSLMGALYTLVKTGAIEKVPNRGSITAAEIAATVDIDVSVIIRLMRMALVNGFFTETGQRYIWP